MFKLSSKETTSNVAERLKHRLDDLQRRNRVLEQERQSRIELNEIFLRFCASSFSVIQEKLEDLISNNYQPVSIYNHDPRRFLHQLKEQQQLNEKAVSFLQQRLVYPYKSNIETQHFHLQSLLFFFDLILFLARWWIQMEFLRIHQIPSAKWRATPFGESTSSFWPSENKERKEKI